MALTLALSRKREREHAEPLRGQSFGVLRQSLIFQAKCYTVAPDGHLFAIGDRKTACEKKWGESGTTDSHPH
jgi:hypothetical protein